MEQFIKNIKTWLYKGLKLLWLLAHGAILPVAIFYLNSSGYLKTASGEIKLSILVPLVVILILWIIGMALISMYRFPLDIFKAAQIVLLLFLQIAVLYLFGDLFFAIYTTFLTSTAAIAIIAGTMSIIAANSKTGLLKGIIIALVVLAIATWIVFVLSQPFIKEFLKIPNFWEQLIAIVVIVANIGSTVANLHRLSIFSGNSDMTAELDKEWEKWAAPTVIVFILSTVLAFVLGGIYI